jgi:large subunit ribosomal protein L18
MNTNKISQKRRIRAKISGTAEIPRLSVSTSLMHIQAQIIDDSKGVTLCAATDIKEKGTKTEKAERVGTAVAEKAKGLKIKKVVFDRGTRIYHGRVKALAEAARKAGLEF